MSPKEVKAKESEINLPTSAGSSKKQDSSRKTSISVLFNLFRNIGLPLFLLNILLLSQDMEAT